MAFSCGAPTGSEEVLELLELLLPDPLNQPLNRPDVSASRIQKFAILLERASTAIARFQLGSTFDHCLAHNT